MRKLILAILLLGLPFSAEAKGTQNPSYCAEVVAANARFVFYDQAVAICKEYDENEINCAFGLERLMRTPITPGTKLYPGLPRKSYFGGFAKALQICRNYTVEQIKCADRLVNTETPYASGFFGNFEGALEVCKQN